MMSQCRPQDAALHKKGEYGRHFEIPNFSQIKFGDVATMLTANVAMMQHNVNGKQYHKITGQQPNQMCWLNN